MERSFSRFSDYFGLSSIIQPSDAQDIGFESDHKMVQQMNTYSLPDDAWLDKRLEEIVNKHKLELKLKSLHEKSKSIGIYQSRMYDVGNQRNMPCSAIHDNLLGIGGIACSNSYQSPYGDDFLSKQISKVGGLDASLPPLCNQFTPSHSTQLLNSTGSSPAQSSFLSNMLDPTPPLCQYEQSWGSLASSKITQEISMFNNSPNHQLQQHVVSNGCSFCRNNKEVETWVASHQLKDSLNRVTCPILRSYVCPLCFAKGDNAHTLGHCPLNPDKNSSLPMAVRRRTNAIGKIKL